MTENAIIIWRDSIAKKVEETGAEMFMGLPDVWYNDAHWFCEKGHVSRRFLSSDKGDRCLKCNKSVRIGPAMSEIDFKNLILGFNRLEVYIGNKSEYLL